MSSTTINYVRGWHRYRKCAFGDLSPGEARAIHNAGGVYAIIVGAKEHPYAFIEVNTNTGFYGVCFLDDELRPELDYSFKVVRPRLLFLSQVLLGEYKKGAPMNRRDATNYFFKEDGSLVIDRIKAGAAKGLRIEKAFDPTPNYEPEPPFGDYASLLRRERPLPAPE